MPNKFVGHGPYHYAEGGHVRKELKFMADKGAPKDMIAAEKKEHGIGGGRGKFRFEEGGDVPPVPDEMSTPVDAPNPNIDDETRARAMAAVGGQAAAAPAVATPPPAFKQAFAAARAAGKPAFEWNGKQYSTELAAPARRAPAAAQAPSRAAGLAATAPAPAAAAAPAQRGGPMQKVSRTMAAPQSGPAAQAAPGPTVQGPNTGTGSNPELNALAVAAARRMQAGLRPASARQTGYAGGGSIDGCATRGKTKAKRY